MIIHILKFSGKKRCYNKFGVYHNSYGCTYLSGIDGIKIYRIEGLRHNEYGPAFKSDTNKYYFLRDKEYPNKDVWENFRNKKEF